MIWALGRLCFFPLLEQALVLTGSLASRGSGVPHLVTEVTCHHALTLSLAELPGTVGAQGSMLLGHHGCCMWTRQQGLVVTRGTRVLCTSVLLEHMLRGPILPSSFS